jgi:hypothetical protein
MPEDLDKARSLLDGGDSKRAVEKLWDIEIRARTNLAEAEALLEVAERARDQTSGRVRRDAVLLVEYAQTYIGRLSRPQALPSARRLSCTALGGFGWDLTPGQPYELDFDEDGVKIYPEQVQAASVTVSYAELVAFAIGGPGAQTTGGGFAGGGFGIEGAAEGILAAGVLNAITSRTRVTTTFSLHPVTAEAFFLHDVYTPYDLRIHLSEVFVRMRQERGRRTADELDQ